MSEVCFWQHCPCTQDSETEKPVFLHILETSRWADEHSYQFTSLEHTVEVQAVLLCRVQALFVVSHSLMSHYIKHAAVYIKIWEFLWQVLEPFSCYTLSRSASSVHVLSGGDATLSVIPHPITLKWKWSTESSHSVGVLCNYEYKH